MAMTTTEQNTINQLLNTAKADTQLAFINSQYVIVRIVPVRFMSASEASAYAVALGTTIASP